MEEEGGLERFNNLPRVSELESSWTQARSQVCLTLKPIFLTSNDAVKTRGQARADGLVSFSKFLFITG